MYRDGIGRFEPLAHPARLATGVFGQHGQPHARRRRHPAAPGIERIAQADLVRHEHRQPRVARLVDGRTGQDRVAVAGGQGRDAPGAPAIEPRIEAGRRVTLGRHQQWRHRHVLDPAHHLPWRGRSGQERLQRGLRAIGGRAAVVDDCFAIAIAPSPGRDLSRAAAGCRLHEDGVGYGHEVQLLGGSLRQHVMGWRGVAFAEVARPAQRTPHGLIAAVEPDRLPRGSQRKAAAYERLRRRGQEAMAHVPCRGQIYTGDTLQRQAGRRVEHTGQLQRRIRGIAIGHRIGQLAGRIEQQHLVAAVAERQLAFA